MEEGWVSPNYSLVDVVEYEMKLQKRRCIEDFCINVFKDYWNNGTTPISRACHQLIDEGRLCSITETISTSITLDSFESTFQAMGSELFANGIVKEEYVISLLAFSIKLDTYLHNYMWYSSLLLITALVKTLEEACFDPLSFKWNQIEDTINVIITSFIVIVPCLLFSFFLFK